ncbi:MAG TPA: hypothetical protein PK771_13545 [Spirochaetota bacterium]|nr:hypothetical protein [Spirochaetota bacterium]
MNKKVTIFIFLSMISFVFASQRFQFDTNENLNFSFRFSSDYYATNKKNGNSSTTKKNGSKQTKKGNTVKKNSGITLTTQQKAGIGVVTTGSVLLIGGVGLLVFDLAYYFPLVKSSMDTVKDSASYLLYEMNYNINLALLITSLSVLSLGLIFAVISIPLFVYKDPGKKRASLDLNVSLKNDFALFLSYKL